MVLTKSKISLSETESFFSLNDYWIKKLEGIEELQLPKGYSNSMTNRTENNIVYFQIDRSLLDNIVAHFRESKPSSSLILLAALKVLLFRYSNQIDFCIGTTFSDPRLNNPTKNNEINFYLDVLPLCTKIDVNMHFGDFVQKLGADLMEVISNNQISVDQLITLLGKKDEKDLRLLFPVIFDYHKNISIDSLKQSPIINLENFNSTLLITIVENDEKIEGRITFDKTFFCSKSANRMVSHFVTLLESIHSHPSQNLDLLNIIPTEERTFLLESLNATETEYPHDKTIVDLFQEQVNKTPDAVALMFKEKRLSYKELNEWSNQFAHYLIARYKIQPDDLVGIELERSEWMVISILAIIKSGGAYVPIDPEYPEQRKEFIKEDAKLKIVINQIELEGFIKAIKEGNYPNTNPTTQISPENLMYVIYTSGSTGKPKGCMLEHRGLVNRLAWMQKSYALTEKDCILQKTTFTFDVSVWELIWWSLQGACVSMLEPGGEKQPEKIVSAIEASHITVLHFVPSMLEVFLEYLRDSKENILKLSSLKQVYTSGEALKAEHVKRFKELLPDVSLMNLYGPTEASIDVSYYACDTAMEQSVPIGKPIDNTALYVLNPTHHLVPYGTVGEICIGGIGLARGYLNREELTREKFIQNPYNQNERLYRTGDLGRWREDGNLEYLGRMDDQVKIRGYRIELGEIESVLLLHPSVKQAVVIARENEQGDKRLLGYVVCDGNFDKKSISDFLRSKLPHYMVPALWVELQKLPLTFSGKIDRKALPDINTQDLVTTGYNEPKSSLEKKLTTLFEKILDLDRVGIHDDFFELGGHSLLAVKFMSALENETGTKLGINLIFKYPNISELAKAIEYSNQNQAELNSFLEVKASGSKPPLYMVHGGESSASIYFNLAKYIDPEQPIYGFQPKGLDGIEAPDKSIEEMAAYYISLMVGKNPDGPFNLSGYCFGGIVAYEMAKQLQLIGKKVNKLILFDTVAFDYRERHSQFERIKLRSNIILAKINFFLNEPEAYLIRKKRYFKRKMDLMFSKMKSKLNPRFVNTSTSYLDIVSKNNTYLLNQYKIVPYHGILYLFRAKIRETYLEEPKFYGWKSFVEKVNVIDIGGHHHIIFSKNEICKEIAEKIQIVLDEKADS